MKHFLSLITIALAASNLAMNAVAQAADESPQPYCNTCGPPGTLSSNSGNISLPNFSNTNPPNAEAPEKPGDTPGSVANGSAPSTGTGTDTDPNHAQPSDRKHSFRKFLERRAANFRDFFGTPSGAPNMGLVPITPNMTTLQDAGAIGQAAYATETTQNSFDRTQNYQSNASTDERYLSKPYEAASAFEASERLRRATENLAKTAELLEKGKLQNLNSAERSLFQNQLYNAIDKAELAQEIINQLQEQAKKSGTPLSDIFKRKELRDLLGRDLNDQDSAANRLLLLNGLTEAERRRVLEQLALADQVKVIMPDGSTRTIPLLHSGFTSAQAKADLDCSTFVAATLTPQFRKWNLTTMDLRGIWQLSRSGELPKDARWTPDREAVLKKLAPGFKAVNPYLGEAPRPGDILVSRIPWEANGRVVIVKRYDPKRMVARVAQPNPRTTKLVEYDFDLSLDPQTEKTRYVRPGLVNLRLSADDNPACKYRDGGKK